MMLRNSGIISQGEYKGKTIDETRKYSEEGGYSTKITEEMVKGKY